jgi:RNA polymerase sigma-54 factor
MLRQSLSQKMMQKLSPQQIQLMKLLQIPTANLEERIKEELEANPALEEGDDTKEVFDIEEENDYDSDGEIDSDSRDEVDLGEYLNQYLEDDPATYKMREDHDSEEMKSIPFAVEASFHEHLNKQLGMLEFHDPLEEIIAQQIIGSIDEDGYLRRDTVALADDLLFAQGIEIPKEKIDTVLKIIQKFDPPGVAARDLQECLILQLNDKIEKNKEYQTRTSTKLALKILASYFEEFSKKHYSKLKRSLGISDSELKDAIDEILKLSPKPSGTVEELNAKSEVQYIIPDFTIINRDGELDLTLNSKNAPELRISDQYSEMLKGYKESLNANKSNNEQKKAVLFIKQKIDSAKWFIDAIQQRQDTMFRTMYAIMQYQYDYFLTGDERKSRPMILKDIAEITGLDISTVSRVVNSKFVQTEFGTKRLKDFFSESMTTQEGEEVSTLEVKNLLSEIVAREDKRKPHSDEKLMEMLQKKGYNIARRTIAKYRELLNIPVARLRKEI